ncbi:AMP-binding protein [Pseudooceanicola nanhaiensis]|uniref:AMP-binding protein n=1 Tax=Pseudooceanicola nanhaiensis TaxID=375761 RepID=UPI001CD5303B|nr:AMP-binding protein [Pseudooceanicola nanhaiensis]MCA0919562.1 AMP-binding protein [Pseudooceanicola nanhaiensis]
MKSPDGGAAAMAARAAHDGDRSGSAERIIPEAKPRPWWRHYPEGVDPLYRPRAVCINRLLAEAFETHAGALYLDYHGDRLTYGETRERVGRAAAVLAGLGIGAGDRVALHLPNCLWHPIFFFGTLSLGAVVVHLSPLDAPAEIAKKLEDSGARLVISLTTPEFTGALAGAVPEGVQVALLPDAVSAAGRDCPWPEGALDLAARLEAETETRAPRPMAPSDIALLQYTGGTTGVPKAAVLTHGNLAAAAQMYRHGSQAEPSSRAGSAALVYAPLFHIMGLVSSMMKRTLEGGTLYLRQRFDPAACLEEIERNRINVMSGVPTAWIALLRQPDLGSRDLSSLEYAASGGAPLAPEVYERVRQATGLRLRGGWGMTETCAAGTQVPASQPGEKCASIGIPVPGLDLCIFDPDDPGRELPQGETGEIAVRGPNVTAGYWNRSDLAGTTHVGDWFLTGDIGYIDEAGFVFLVDRKKDLILSGGFNVYPLMIEKAIHEHPDVAEAMVIGIPDAYRGESAKAFVVLRPGAESFTLEALQAFLASRLGRHEIPRALAFRSDLPRTKVGKGDRRALRAEEEAARAAS